jgi:hypothetical protein
LVGVTGGGRYELLSASATEARWFAEPERHPAELPYGWAWALTLVAERNAWADPDAVRWAGNLRPLPIWFACSERFETAPLQQASCPLTKI